MNNNEKFIEWYFKLIVNNLITTIFLEYKFNILKFLYKLVFFSYYSKIKFNMIKILNSILNLKFLSYIEFNCKIFCKYFIKYLQNIKNKLVYFKSSHYYYKKQKLIRRRKRHTPLVSFLSTSLKRNWFSLKNRSSNFFVFCNIYLLNTRMVYNVIRNDINLYHFFFLIMGIIPYIKKKIFNLNNTLLLTFFVYIILFFIIVSINKSFLKETFINRDYYKLNFKFAEKKKKSIFLKNLDYTSFDQFEKNKPIYKNLLLITSFINFNKLNDYIKNYKKFFFIKNFPMVNILNDFLMCSEWDIRKNKISFKYQKWSDDFSFNINYIYWIIFIPLFFIQYILVKFHLKLYVKTKRRIYYLVRSYLDNIRLYVKINKYLGRSFFKSIYRSKRWKDPSHVFLSKKRPKKGHFSVNFIRYRKLYYRLSPIGSYYFWISKINIIQYLFSYKYFFFKTIIKSYYYFWIIITYIIVLIFLMKKEVKSLRKKGREGTISIS